MDSDVIVIGELPDADEAELDATEAAPVKPDGLPDHAKLNEDGSVTLPLCFPVEQKTRKANSDDVQVKIVHAFTFHRLKGRDLVRISEAKKGEGGILGMALSARIPDIIFKRLFDEMDAADIQACGQVLGYFLGNGRSTGG